MRFTQTNDIVSTKYVSIDPALGLEFGYTDLVLFEQVLVIFKMYNNLTIPERSVFNLILDWDKYKGIQIDYALTDLGIKARPCTLIFFFQIDLALLETDNKKNDFNTLEPSKRYLFYSYF
jgi:hypothetical protein